jgi:hypothetical protein
VCGFDPVDIESLLYCPDYVVKGAGSAGIDPARIVDARRRADLIPVIRSILPADGPRLASRAKVERFLGDILQLVPEVHAVVGEAHGLYTRLAGGLAEWARRIDCEPFRLRVTGTAGSGKTQLALAAYRDALAAGGARSTSATTGRWPTTSRASPRPAARWPPTTSSATAPARPPVKVPDFSAARRLRPPRGPPRCHQPTPAEQFDELIVDEGQDFRPAWRDNLLRFLRSPAAAPGGSKTRCRTSTTARRWRCPAGWPAPTPTTAARRSSWPRSISTYSTTRPCASSSSAPRAAR